MKNHLPFLITTILFCHSLHAQSPQFAVVKPNGTTQIYSSWANAYNAAVNDDYIYLPGVGISGAIVINKRIHIYGSGHHPDSTSATSKTVFTGPIEIYGGANGGSIEGILNTGSINIGYNGTKVSNYTIKYCNISNSINLGISSADSLPEYITITSNVLSSLGNNYSNSSNNILIEKNVIRGSIARISNSLFKNNIFLLTSSIFSNVSNSNIENNIFIYGNPVPPESSNCFNSFFNNLKVGNADFTESGGCPILAESGNLFVTNYNEIFISYENNGFDYNDNYHLKPSCPGVGAGTDGTDLGIYGTSNPTSEGWVPSNPHIYLKDIDPSTGPDGKLHIEVGVRANNN